MWILVAIIVHKKKRHCLSSANARHDNAEMEPMAHVYDGTSTIYAMTHILYSLHFSGIFNNRYCKSNDECAVKEFWKLVQIWQFPPLVWCLFGTRCACCLFCHMFISMQLIYDKNVLTTNCVSFIRNDFSSSDPENFWKDMLPTRLVRASATAKVKVTQGCR